MDLVEFMMQKPELIIFKQYFGFIKIYILIGFKQRVTYYLSYKIWISPDAPFALKLFGEDLVESRNFKKTTFIIDYPNLAKNKYTLFPTFYFKASMYPVKTFVRFNN